MKTIETVWAVRTYDVWGNRRDGFEVNDSYSRGEITVRAKVEIHNEGTAHEFISAHLTDWQLGNIFGTRAALDVTGDDTHCYVNRASDSYPIGELSCVSHRSLSPIRR